MTKSNENTKIQTLSTKHSQRYRKMLSVIQNVFLVEFEIFPRSVIEKLHIHITWTDDIRIYSAWSAVRVSRFHLDWKHTSKYGIHWNLGNEIWWAGELTYTGFCRILMPRIILPWQPFATSHVGTFCMAVWVHFNKVWKVQKSVFAFRLWYTRTLYLFCHFLSQRNEVFVECFNWCIRPP